MQLGAYGVPKGLKGVRSLFEQFFLVHDIPPEIAAGAGAYLAPPVDTPMVRMKM